MPKQKNALADYLSKHNIKPAEFARMTGVTRQTVNEKLRRDRHALTLATYDQIAKAVNKPTWQVLKEIEQIEKNKKELRELLK